MVVILPNLMPISHCWVQCGGLDFGSEVTYIPIQSTSAHILLYHSTVRTGRVCRFSYIAPCVTSASISLFLRSSHRLNDNLLSQNNSRTL